MKSYLDNKLWSMTAVLYGMLYVKTGEGDPNPISPVTPGGPPEGSEGLSNGIKFIGAWGLLIGMGVGVIFTIFALVRAAWKSDRYKISDAKTPLIVALLCSAFALILQVIYGIFEGVVSSFGS